MTREETLEKARQCVCGDREQDYGSPESNFATIAEMWNAYLDANISRKISPKDVAAMMALMKIARIASGHAKDDNWIDLAGYAACGAEIESGKKFEPCAIAQSQTSPITEAGIKTLEKRMRCKSAGCPMCKHHHTSTCEDCDGHSKWESYEAKL